MGTVSHCTKLCWPPLTDAKVVVAVDVALSSLKLGVQAVDCTITAEFGILGAAELDATEEVWIGVLLPPFDVKFGRVFFDVPGVLNGTGVEDGWQASIVVQESFDADRQGTEIEEKGTVDAIIDLGEFGRIWTHVLGYRIIALSDSVGDLVQVFFDTDRDSRSFSDLVELDVVVPSWRLRSCHVDIETLATLHSVFGW